MKNLSWLLKALFHRPFTTIQYKTPFQPAPQAFHDKFALQQKKTNKILHGPCIIIISLFAITGLQVRLTIFIAPDHDGCATRLNKF